MNSAICALGITLMLVLFLDPTDANPSCGLPPDTGVCRGRFTRYYYDQKSGRCSPFTWGGCGGNANNFRNVGDCLSACAPSSGPIVFPTPGSGPIVFPTPSSGRIVFPTH